VEIKQVILRCELMKDGCVVAEGIGARSMRQDDGDLNKCLKMASKSAHIDATLRMGGLSEVFTQDIEDLPKERQEAIQPVSQTPFAKSRAAHQNAAPVNPAPKPAAVVKDLLPKEPTFKTKEWFLQQLRANHDEATLKMYFEQKGLLLPTES